MCRQSAATHGQGLVLAQVDVHHKTNEIPMFARLLDGIDISGMLITAASRCGALPWSSAPRIRLPSTAITARSSEPSSPSPACPDPADAAATTSVAMPGTCHPPFRRSFAWPTYQHEPMLLLAQIDCAQVTSLLAAQWTFPAEGCLLFFHDDNFLAPSDRHGDDGCRVLHVAAGSGAESIATMPAVPLDAAAMPALPDIQDDAETAVGIGVVEMLDLWEELRPLLPPPRHRLLGHCDTETPSPPGHRPLLQVDAEPGTTWGEIVNVSFWITDADLLAGRMDRIRRAYEVA